MQQRFKYPLATTSWGAEEIESIQEVVRSGSFTMGEKVREFEEAFAKEISVPYAVMVNSGSSANLLAIASLFYTQNPNLRLKRGDEVIVPAISWSTTYYPLYQYGLKIKFVDVDLNTLNFDIEKLSEAITSKTRLILAVNLLGNPNDFRTIQKIIGDKNIILIEDNCESLGATYNNKAAGTFGKMGTFSSFFSHHISTMEGGMVVTSDEELYHILLCLRAHGWTRNLPKYNKVTGIKSDDCFEESFKFVLPGYNVRPLEIEAAIGIEQLKKLPGFIRQRRRNAEMLRKVMDGHPDVMIQREIGESSWFGFSLVLRPTSNWKRFDLLNKLTILGFECRPIVTGNFAKNEVVKYFNYEVSGDLSAANHIDKNGLFIGNHHYENKDAIYELEKIW